MTATFSVLIGSIGRPELRHALDSIARQGMQSGDQCIVGFDAFEQSVDDLEARCALVRSYGDGFLACAYDAGYHWYGVEQINYALRTLPITGSHIFTIGDDDLFVDGAWDRLRPLCDAEPLQPILYKFVAPWRQLLWHEPQMLRSGISGCCIAAPSRFVGPMPTALYVEHDFDWMMDILQRAGIPPLWLDEVLVIARPNQRGDDVTHQGVWRCPDCDRWRFLEDMPSAAWACDCGRKVA